MVPADERHCYRSVFGHRDHRWLDPFGGEQRCHRADQDTAGAEPEDRPAGFEQLSDVRRCAFEALVPTGRECTRSVQAGARQCRLQAAAERRAGGAEHDNRDIVRWSLDHGTVPSSGAVVSTTPAKSDL